MPTPVNPLAPQSDPASTPGPNLTGGPAAPMGMPDPLSGIAQAHNAAKVRLAKTTQATQMLGSIRSELEHLAGMEDMVTQDDVVKSAGKLVGAGATPNELASLLADMPPDGQGLANWVQDHLASVDAREAQVGPAHEMAKHSVAATGIQMLTGQHVMGAQQTPGPAASTSNPLMPGAA
jgi:hypothetical protein